MEIKTVYVTSDGKQFDDGEKAAKYEDSLVLYKRFGETYVTTFPSVPQGFSYAKPKDVCDWLVRNREKLLNFLNSIEEEND